MGRDRERGSAGTVGKAAPHPERRWTSVSAAAAVAGGIAALLGATAGYCDSAGHTAPSEVKGLPPPGPVAASSGSSGARARIIEIVPPATYAMPRTPAGPSVATAVGGAKSCVSVFVRSAKVDGREVVSVDLHGDGLIKGAVPPHLAGELLARAGPAADAGGARAACVTPALAQSLFNPVVNLAAVDPAVRMARVGDRWVIAGGREPEPVAKAEVRVPLVGRRVPVQIVEPRPVLQLAAATTTRGAEPQARKPTKPRQTPPQRAARVGAP